MPAFASRHFEAVYRSAAEGGREAQEHQSGAECCSTHSESSGAMMARRVRRDLARHRTADPDAADA